MDASIIFHVLAGGLGALLFLGVWVRVTSALDLEEEAGEAML